MKQFKYLLLCLPITALAQTPIPDYFISETGVTQHQAAITVTESQVSDLAHTAAESTTVSDTAEVDLTLVGVDITGDIVAGSIDETKLDVSTNASLDLADSASQGAHTIDTDTTDHTLFSNIGTNAHSVIDSHLAAPGHTTDTNLTQEEVEDYAGALIQDGTGTHTGIAVTYQDATGDVDMVIDHDAATNFDVGEHFTQAAISITESQVSDLAHTTAESTSVTDTAEVDLTLTGSAVSADLIAGSIDETKLDASTNASLDLADSASQGAHTTAEGTTVSDTAEIDLTLTTLDITGAIVAGSIDETKLDASTNASLDLADSAIQTAHEGTNVLSTGETVGKKFLREDGDNSSSWQRITQITNDFEPESTITGSGTGFNLQFGAGDALYLNGSAGTSGQFIKTNGAGSAPTFATVTSESTTVSDTATIDLTLTGVDVSGIVVANSITTAELSDAADVPLVGEFVQVATGGINVQYRTDAEVRADLDLEIGTDIDAAGTDNSTDVTLAGTGTYVTAVGQVLTVDPIDISTDTNLTGDAEIVLTGDALSIASTIARDTELHGNGTNCSAGNYPLGVDASGNAESCTSAAGGGDVLKVGTPVNDQIGIWTGDGTIEGDAGLTFDGTNKILTVENSGTTGKVTLESQFANGAIKIGNFTATPAADTKVGQILFQGYDDASVLNNYARIQAHVTDDTAGAETGYLSFLPSIGGSNTEALRIDGAGDVSIPNGDLSVTGDVVMPEKADHSGTPAAGNGYLWTKNTAPSSLMYTDDAGTDHHLAGRDIRARGYVSSTITLTTPGTWYTMTGAESYDPNGDHNPTNGRFTCPITGNYSVRAGITFNVAADQDLIAIGIQKNGSFQNAVYRNAGGTNIETVVVSAIIPCTAAQYITIVAYNGSNTDTIYTGNLYSWWEVFYER